MDIGSSVVRVLGVGHLAAAVRIHLQHLRPHASHMDCWINCDAPALFLACSDFENTTLRRSLAERARADRASMLFACLQGRSARIGPLVSPFTNDFAHCLTRSWDFSPAKFAHHFPTQHTDKRLTHLAQIGATFIVGELAKVLSDYVTKIDSPTRTAECHQAIPELDAGTLVATHDVWRDTGRLPLRPWHPALPPELI